MSVPARLACGAVVLIMVTLSAQPAGAWGMEDFGPAGGHIGRSADWPKGVEGVLRHPSRVYRKWVNGNENAYYDGDIEAVNELLQLFAKVDLTSHHVVLRSGRPSARSFHGKLTPYAVQFELPGGIYLGHIRKHASTGLYALKPRLIVHVNEALAKHVDKLVVPEKVSLHETTHRIEDALAAIESGDLSLRVRSITVLGEAGDSAAVVMKALNRAAASDDETARNRAQRAIKQIEQDNSPPQRALKQKVAVFLKNHPQRQRTPRPTELLAILREIDDTYAQGFTAMGTMVEPDLSGSAKLIAWTITMGDGRLVLRKRATGDPKTPGRLKETIYVGPDQMAMIQRSMVYVNDNLIETKPLVTFEPVGPTYDILIGRVLWTLGRGITRSIRRISRVAAKADGTLTAEAESHAGQMRWELTIDPQANFLVRFARGFHHRASEAAYTIDTAGVLASGERSTTHTARWIEGASAAPISISVTTFSAEADTELIRQTEELLNQSGEDR